MAEENGKPRSETEEPTRNESEISRPGLEKYALGKGPWTEEDERWFQFMVSEFGGAADAG